MLGKTVLRFEVKAGPTGSLFGSVTPTDIADEIWRTQKIRVDRRKIGIDTIKRIGRYEVPIEVFQDVTGEVKTLVVPEGGELPPEEELAAMEAAGARRARRRRRSRGEPTRPRAAPSEAAAEAEAVAEAAGRRASRRNRGRSGRDATSAEPRARDAQAAVESRATTRDDATAWLPYA